MPLPENIDSLSPAELKDLVYELLGKVVQLERTVAAQRDEIARLKGGPGRPNIKPSSKPSGMEQATDPKPPGRSNERHRRGGMGSASICWLPRKRRLSAQQKLAGKVRRPGELGTTETKSLSAAHGLEIAVLVPPQSSRDRWRIGTAFVSVTRPADAAWDRRRRIRRRADCFRHSRRRKQHSDTHR
jgi:hypothetical protein